MKAILKHFISLITKNNYICDLSFISALHLRSILAFIRNQFKLIKMLILGIIDFLTIAYNNIIKCKIDSISSQLSKSTL